MCVQLMCQHSETHQHAPHGMMKPPLQAVWAASPCCVGYDMSLLLVPARPLARRTRYGFPVWPLGAVRMQEDAAAAKKDPAKAPAASEQEGGGNARASRGRSASEAPPVHWWQDPQAAFGAAVPAEARQRVQGLSASASKPARPASAEPASRKSR